ADRKSVPQDRAVRSRPADHQSTAATRVPPRASMVPKIRPNMAPAPSNSGAQGSPAGGMQKKHPFRDESRSRRTSPRPDDAVPQAKRKRPRERARKWPALRVRAPYKASPRTFRATEKEPPIDGARTCEWAGFMRSRKLRAEALARDR